MQNEKHFDENELLLSVVIPVYNVEKYVAECIDSIFNQGLSTTDFEIILVNDGSKDNSQFICEKYAREYSNIRLINQENQGLSAARNAGIKNAKGLYLYMIDSDDFLRKDAFGVLLDFIKRKNLDFLGFGICRTSARNISKGFNQEIDIIFEGSGLDILKNINYNNGPWWYIIRKDLLNDLQFTVGKYCEDGPFTARALMNVKRGVIITNECYNYYQNEVSITNSTDPVKNAKIMADMFFAVNDFHNILNSVPIENKKAYDRLRERQETYLYFGIIRFLKLNQPFAIVESHINKLIFKNYKVYPLNAFKGYDNRDKLLIRIINRKWTLRSFNYLNMFFKIIK